MDVSRDRIGPSPTGSAADTFDLIRPVALMVIAVFPFIPAKAPAGRSSSG
jgi:hypothetical protein